MTERKQDLEIIEGVGQASPLTRFFWGMVCLGLVVALLRKLLS